MHNPLIVKHHHIDFHFTTLSPLVSHLSFISHNILLDGNIVNLNKMTKLDFIVVKLNKLFQMRNLNRQFNHHGVKFLQTFKSIMKVVLMTKGFFLA